MAVYKYVAIRKNGIEVKGQIDAENIRAARYLLYDNKMNVLSIKKRFFFYKKNIIKKRYNKSDLVLITRQIATLVNASMPLDEVLNIVGRQNENSKMINVIKEIRGKILEGHSLSEALSQFPSIFSPLYKSMITAGELSGHLGLVLVRLAEHIERAQKIQRKIIQALIYPFVLILISLSVIVVLLSAVVPNIVEQFTFVGKELPLSTKILMILSYGVKDNIILIFSAFVFFVFIFNACIKIDKVNFYLNRCYLNFPILGNMLIRVNVSRYFRTLATLYSNGVAIVQAMNISNAVLTNINIKNKLTNSVKLVSEGCSLSSALLDTKILSPMILHMIISGERSGKLDSILEMVANTQEEELMAQIGILMALLEPVIIIIMATFILFIILSILQPILQINSIII